MALPKTFLKVFLSSGRLYQPEFGALSFARGGKIAKVVKRAVSDEAGRIFPPGSACREKQLSDDQVAELQEQLARACREKQLSDDKVAELQEQLASACREKHGKVAELQEQLASACRETHDKVAELQE